MTKEQLKQELLKKIKPGIKPSDLKKQGKNHGLNLTQAKNNLVKTEEIVKTNEQLLTPPHTPPLKPTKNEDLPPPISINQKPATNQAKLQPTPNPIKPFRCSSCLITKKSAPIYLKVATTDPPI